MEGVLGLSSDQQGLYWAGFCNEWQKIMVQLHTTQQPLLHPTEIRRCGVILQYAADRSRHTKDRVLQSAAFHHYREAYTRPFHDIRLQLSQNQRYCTNIEKAQRGVVTQTVAFHTIIKLHFLRATDIVPYCATQWGQCQYYTVRSYHSATKLRLCHRHMTSKLAEPTFQRCLQHRQ